MTEFVLGNIVEWTSQSRGQTTVKRGRVVFVDPGVGSVVRVYRDPYRTQGRAINVSEVELAVKRGWLEAELAEDLKAGRFQRMSDGFGPVVVAIERRHKQTGERLLPFIYSPRPEWLRLVEED